MSDTPHPPAPLPLPYPSTEIITQDKKVAAFHSWTDLDRREQANRRTGECQPVSSSRSTFDKLWAENVFDTALNNEI